MGLTKTLYEYQKTASLSLQSFLSETLKDLKNENTAKYIKSVDRIKLLSAPTGSGKTLTVSDVVVETAQAWHTEGKDTVFFMLAPNSLNHQLHADMVSNGVGSEGILNLRSIKEVASGLKLKPWDFVFTNYSSIDKEKNTVIVENENGTDLNSQMESLRSKGVNVVLIVDEAHVNYSGDKAQKFINNILQPDLTILVTATPHERIEGYINPSSQTVEVKRQDAIDSGALVKSVIVNKGISEISNTQDEDGEYKTVNLKFLDMAIAMKKRMDAAYENEGSDTRCLIGVQIPSKVKNVFEISEEHGERRKDNQHEKDMLHYVLDHLEKKNPEWIVTPSDDNKGHVDDKVAIWLAQQKTHNVADEIIKPNDSHVDVLIFKEAVAVGWDCPRMGAGALLRDTKTKPFAQQTIGRFMRMPEQKHYDDDLLNHGYIYTAYDMVKKMLEESETSDTAGNIELEPKEVPICQDNKTLSILKQLESYGGLPFDYRKKNNNPVLSMKNIRAASHEFLKSRGVSPQIGGGISNSDYKNKIGINTNHKNSRISILDEQEVNPDDIDAEYKIISSNIYKGDVDKQREYEALIASSVSIGNIVPKQAAFNLRDHILDDLLPTNVVEGNSLSESEFIDIITASEDNKTAFKSMLDEIISSASAKQGASGRPDEIKRAEKNWFPYEKISIPHENAECKSCALDSSYVRPAVDESLYECIDSRPGSIPEQTYLDTVISKIKDYLEKTYKGTIVHRYLKNGEQGSHFGIKYHYSGKDRIFYPDFMHFYWVNNELYISIIEVKEIGSHLGDTPEHIKVKAKALEEYCSEMRTNGFKIDGEVWAFGNTSSSRKDITVIDPHSDQGNIAYVDSVVENHLESLLKQ